MPTYWDRSANGFLRRPTRTWMRSAYAIEVNPWTTKGDIEAALLFRGTIVSAHGYIETRLGELCFRCSRMPEYNGLRSQFPSKLKGKISYLQCAFSQPPLEPFADIAVRFFKRVEESADLRHLVAHARMQVESEWGVVFHDYIHPIGGAVRYRRERMTLDQLEFAAFRAAKLSRSCQRLADHLERSELIPA